MEYLNPESVLGMIFPGAENKGMILPSASHSKQTIRNKLTALSPYY